MGYFSYGRAKAKVSEQEIKREKQRKLSFKKVQMINFKMEEFIYLISFISSSAILKIDFI